MSYTGNTHIGSGFFRTKKFEEIPEKRGKFFSSRGGYPKPNDVLNSGPCCPDKKDGHDTNQDKFFRNRQTFGTNPIDTCCGGSEAE